MKGFSKKLLSIVVAILLVATMTIGSAFTSSAATYAGDLDNDKSVGSTDLTIIRQALLGIIDGTGLDVNGDGVLTLKDLVRTKIIAVNFEKGEKFEIKYEGNTLNNVETYKLGDLFKVVDGAQVDNTVNFEVTGVECDIDYADNWADTTIKFKSTGNASISIYEYCPATTLDIKVGLVDKFVAKDNTNVYVDEDYTLGYFFDSKEYEIDSANVCVTVNGEDYTLTDTTDWKNSAISFATVGEYVITISENSNVVSITVTTEYADKFIAHDVECYIDETIKLGDLFGVEDGKKVDSSKVTVTVDGNAYTLTNTTDWTQNEITFSTEGTHKVVISENSKEAEATVTVKILPVEFVSKFTNDYLYRVGNQNAVALGSLFGTKDNAVVKGNVVVNVETVEGDATGTYTSNADWTKSTINFDGTGFVIISIKEANASNPVDLELEVVDAMNATSAMSANKNSVVLLNDCGFGTLDVGNGYTLYGNGFKLTNSSDVIYHAMGVGFITLNNGILDNVQVICPDFSHAVLYTKNIKENGNYYDSNSQKYGNVRSAVMVDGNSKILNSYIHGGRAAVYARSGSLVIDNSTISGGAVANIHVLPQEKLTLRDVTLVQKPYQATVHDTSKTLMGFSALLECDENGSAPVVLEGKLIQNAWVNDEYAKYAPSTASGVIDEALDKTDYLHDLDGDGKNESLNLGFTYMPNESGGTLTTNIEDKRTNKADIPYETVDVKAVVASAKVYSYKNSNGTSDEFKNEVSYVSTKQGVIAPVLTYTDVSADRTFETIFDETDNRWESTLTVNLDNGDYNFSFDTLLAQKYGKNLTYTVKNGDTAIDTSKTISLTQSGVNNYTLTVADGDETHTLYFIITATKTSIPEPERVTPDGSATALLVVKAKNDDWSCAVPALEGIKIKYYKSASSPVTLDLATLTPSSTGKANGTYNYWETSKDGYKLKVTCGYIHEGKQVYGMPVVVNNSGNKMYFTISSTNGYVSTSTASRTVTLTYEFTDPNGKSITFEKTWQFNYADYKSGKQYSYSDFVNGTLKEASSSSPCVTPDTLVTLADGTKKEIQYVTAEDKLLVWNFYEGKYDVVPSAIIFDHGADNNTVIKLTFSDGTTVKVVNIHQFFDTDLNKFVTINKDTVSGYVGHKFAKCDGNSNTSVELVDYSITEEYIEAWGIISALHYNIITEDMLSADFELQDFDLFNYFEVGTDMTFDAEKMQEDIEKYGLYTYDDFSDYLTYEQFVAFNVQYFKIPVSKGYYTYEGILGLIEYYLK